MDLETIVKEINKLYATCVQLKREMIDIGLFSDILLEKVDSTDYEIVLSNIKIIMESNCIQKNSSAHRKLVEGIVNRVREPKTYLELHHLLDSLGITTHDEAIVFDDLISKYYNEDVVKSILGSIANGTYTKLSELFEMDVFFNEYVEGLNQIEKHVSDLHLFEKVDQELLYISVELCPNIAGLQSYMAEILSKNEYLMTRGINVYDVLHKADAVKAECFFENILAIEKFIEQKIQGEYDQEKENYDVSRLGEKRKMYVLDTCALMHNPDLLLYFTDDEYVRIPTKVIDELGKIKDKRNHKYEAGLSDTARRIASDIDKYYLQLFNHRNKIRFLIENAALDLLPKDLDATVPDNQILSVALKYKDWETYIVSDDGVFRLTAQAQSIKAITSVEFIEMHKESKKDLNDWIKNVNSQSKDTLLIEEDVYGKEKVATNAGVGKKGIEIIEKSFDSNVATREEQKMLPDNRPVHELKKYISDFTDPVISYLVACGIRTIGDFCMLTEGKVKNFPAKGKQMVYKNTVMRSVKQMNTIIPRIR